VRLRQEGAQAGSRARVAGSDDRQIGISESGDFMSSSPVNLL